jgi:uncharacterized protein (TIGR03086 family)
VQDLFVTANQHFTDLVDQIDDDQWDNPVPSTPGWTVQQLVGHVTENNLAVTRTLGGNDLLVGDMDEDPAAAWDEMANKAEEAALSWTEMNAEVEGPEGSTRAEDYIKSQIADRTIHGWDLAKAIGADSMIHPELVATVYEYLEPQAEHLRSTGVFGPEVSVAPDAPLQSRLIGLTGRQP